MMLFWFGVVAQLMVTFGSLWQYSTTGQSIHLGLGYNWVNDLDFSMRFIYLGFAHFIHITAGYWLSKGSRKGLALGLFISVYEIIPFFIGGISLGNLHNLPTTIQTIEPWMPSINPLLLTPDGFAIRVFFAVNIFLLIWGRKDLSKLQELNWRPWKNTKRK